MLCEYVPLVHFADAPVGSVLLALLVVELAVLVVDLVVVAAGAAAVAAAGAAAVGVPTPPWCEHAPFPEVPIVPSLHVTGVPEAAVVAAAGAALVADVAVVAAFGVVDELVGVPTPPWCEHAPFPEVPIVPSLHVTGVPECCR